ncbi:MAG TPA: hypothetical protein VNP04_03945 [Alphaproteobacteria bacterium]|nr:hypothetical protein [Alphaproteobacteria bacterium]
MSTDLATMAPPPLPTEIEQVVIGGDLSKLTTEQRLTYYAAVCRSLGLNPLTKPFEYLYLNGKLQLYARRDCTDQLRRVHGITVYISSRERLNDIYVVSARARTPDGREDESIGAVSLTGLKGEALANALMKAETKAKRRVTLSIVGLGWLDETEVESLPPAAVSQPIPTVPSTVEAPQADGAGTPPSQPQTRQPLPTGLGEDLATLSKSDLLFRIRNRLMQLYPTASPGDKEDRLSAMHACFGTRRYSQIEVMGLKALRQGLSKLLAFHQETPPRDDDDVPMGDAPRPPQDGEVGDSSETASVPPSSAASAEVSDELVGLPKVNADGFVVPDEIEVLRQWAQMHGQGDVVEDLLRPCEGYPHAPALLPTEYVRAKNAVLWAMQQPEATQEPTLEANQHRACDGQ